MHFDALTLAAVADELRETLEGGRVQQVVLPDSRSVGLEIYAHRQRHYLLLSAHPLASRVHLVHQKLRRGVPKETPLLLLLRKYVRGAALENVELPVPFERVLFLHFQHPRHGISTLAIEPIGRLGNLILINPAGQILDALVRVPPGDNAQRVLLPRRSYELPPPMDKLPPIPVASTCSRDFPLATDEPLWRNLLKCCAGVSPTLAREAVWRATGDADARTGQGFADAQNALAALWTLAATANWMPGITVDAHDHVIAFAPYELHFCAAFKPTDSISEAIAAFYARPERDASFSADEYAGMRGRVAALVRQAQARVQRQQIALAQDEPELGEARRVRTQAEWLLALASQIEDDQTELVVPLEEGSLTIPLDTKRSPLKQAERMFKRAAKLERAAVFIPKRRAQLEADQAFLQQLEMDLRLAQNQPEIAGVREALQAAGFLRQRPNPRDKVQPDRSQPLRFLSPEGFLILVGRNARQNEIVTFKEAGRDDLWLHVRDAPGAHVIIRCGGQPVHAETRRIAAQLAAYFSQQRGEQGVPVAVTRRRFVTRMPGRRLGQVQFRNEETISVPAEMPITEERILRQHEK